MANFKMILTLPYHARKTGLTDLGDFEILELSTRQSIVMDTARYSTAGQHRSGRIITLA